jgi:hypothetical protein
VPKKQQIKLTPGRSGRRVRWTFEVSADLDAAERARVKKPAKRPVKKRQPAKNVARQAGAPAPPQPQAAHDAASQTLPTAVVPSVPAMQTPATVVSNPAVVAATTTPSAPVWQLTRGQVAALSGVAVLAIALIAIPRQPSPAGITQTLEPASVDERNVAAEPLSPSPATDAPVAPVAPPPARSTIKPRTVSEPAKRPTVQRAADRIAPAPTPAPARPVATPDASASATTEATTAAASDAKPAPPNALSATNSPAVTITGCLEISTDGEDFRLADTEGADAPKSRSWRTGFLRKRTAPVNLLGADDPQVLRKSVGKRVTATGVLTNRDLQVSSVRVVGSSCN